MWQRWSNFFEALGRLRLPIRLVKGRTAGDPQASDARGGRDWQAFARSEPLFQVWGPLQGSPWEPYHAIPLFASVDWMDRRRIGPTPEAVVEAERTRLETAERAGASSAGATPVRPDGDFLLPRHARPGAPAPGWLEPGTLCVVDLPGRAAVEAAAWLVADGEAQPVCTFDHWPHPKALLPADLLVAELLRWASTLAEARGRLATDAPPLWVCDAMRLGTRKGRPGEFDNRYYLDDSILPTPRVLRDAGIGRVVYLGWAGDEEGPDAPAAGPHVPLADLVEWFSELLTGGIEIQHVPVWDPELRPRPFQGSARRPRFSPKDYRRSAAGGFGTEVPEPSSSGSSG
ncbi:MAG: hypothetical protein EA422_05895 [Gemmatimonadales bacterium]|nr:MAG: hypothetical protein EA422_05895 [Gemmatimonadales bacterium]